MHEKIRIKVNVIHNVYNSAVVVADDDGDDPPSRFVQLKRCKTIRMKMRKK